MAQLKHTLRAGLMRLADPVVGAIAAGGLRLLRLFDRRRMSDFCATWARRLGPYFKEHRIGRENLVAAFPEKSPEEIDKILLAAWENLGRFVADFAHLDRMRIRTPGTSEAAEIDYSEDTIERFFKLRDANKPILMFSAHLSNWELPALMPVRFGQPSAVLFRRPNLAGAAEAAIRIRGATMGELIATGFDAPLQITRAMRDGKWVGMLVDQYVMSGVPVTFFGRPTTANSTAARIARLLGCPIHGTRATRRADGTYRVDMTDEIPPVFDGEGKVDVQATTQRIIDLIEGWIRDTPEQWLWQHRRWRG